MKRKKSIEHDDEYLRDRTIDPLSLDVHCVEQPILFDKYFRLLVDVEGEFETAKADLELARAEAEIKIRERLSSDKKATESKIRSILELDPKVKAQKQIVSELKADVAFCKVAKEGMIQRGNTLDNLVKLHGQNYFAGPTAGVARRGADAGSESQRKKLKKRLKRD